MRHDLFCAWKDISHLETSVHILQIISLLLLTMKTQGGGDFSIWTITLKVRLWLSKREKKEKFQCLKISGDEFDTSHFTFWKEERGHWSAVSTWVAAAGGPGCWAQTSRELSPQEGGEPKGRQPPQEVREQVRGKFLVRGDTWLFPVWLSGYHQIQAWPHRWPAREGAQGPALMWCSAIVILKFLILHSIMHWAQRIMQLVLTKYVSFLKESLLCCRDVWTRSRVW